VKLLKLNLICIKNCTTSKKRTEIWTIDFKNLNLKNFSSAGKKIGSYWLELAILTFFTEVTFLTAVPLRSLRSLRWLETPLNR